VLQADFAACFHHLGEVAEGRLPVLSLEIQFPDLSEMRYGLESGSISKVVAV
jgi:hypothetical protein